MGDICVNSHLISLRTCHGLAKLHRIICVNPQPGAEKAACFPPTTASNSCSWARLLTRGTSGSAF